MGNSYLTLKKFIVRGEGGGGEGRVTSSEGKVGSLGGEGGLPLCLLPIDEALYKGQNGPYKIF